MKNLVLHHYILVLHHVKLGTSPYIVECSNWVFTVHYPVKEHYNIGSLCFYAMFFHCIIQGKLPWFTSHSAQTMWTSSPLSLMSSASTAFRCSGKQPLLHMGILLF